jgi:hypothetical protein
LSLTSRKQHRLRLVDKRVLWKVFGPKRAEVTEHWRKLHSEELPDLYFWPNIISMDK